MLNVENNNKLFTILEELLLEIENSINNMIENDLLYNGN